MRGCYSQPPLYSQELTLANTYQEWEELIVAVTEAQRALRILPPGIERVNIWKYNDHTTYRSFCISLA